MNLSLRPRQKMRIGRLALALSVCLPSGSAWAGAYSRSAPVGAELHGAPAFPQTFSSWIGAALPASAVPEALPAANLRAAPAIPAGAVAAQAPVALTATPAAPADDGAEPQSSAGQAELDELFEGSRLNAPVVRIQLGYQGLSRLLATSAASEVPIEPRWRSYLQEGYVRNLKDKAALYFEEGRPAPFPDSNMIIVMERGPQPLSAAPK
ncbi:MAG: hypothetical protein A2X37_06040 [Elusimicrobia bacterium GWA2_66_18]|nr:MAG: hypothetical protein A2X37_06040 [Elusimicrobia bacterium GWA2_66_18]